MTLFRFLLTTSASIDITPAEPCALDLHADEIAFDIPSDNPLVALHRESTTSIGLIVFDVDGDRRSVVWTGTVTAIDPQGVAATVRCESPASRLRKRPFNV